MNRRFNPFWRNTKTEKHAPPFAAAANPLLNPTFVGGQAGPCLAQGPQGCVGLQVNDFTLSSAQILALFTTPVAVIPAPGLAGWTINPESFLLRLLAGSAAYTDAGGGAVSFVIGSASQALANNNIFLVTTAPNRAIQRLIGFAATDTAGNPPTDDNAPMNIQKATGNFAAGNGTMHITTYYTVEPSL